MNPDHRTRSGKPIRKNNKTRWSQRGECHDYSSVNPTHGGEYITHSGDTPPEFTAYEERIKNENEIAFRTQELGRRLQDKQLALIDAKHLIGHLEQQVRDQRSEINRLQRMVALQKNPPLKEAKKESVSRSRSRVPHHRRSPSLTQGKLKRSRGDSSSSDSERSLSQS
jgi:hypothetical protein